MTDIFVVVMVPVLRGNKSWRTGRRAATAGRRARRRACRMTTAPAPVPPRTSARSPRKIPTVSIPHMYLHRNSRRNRSTRASQYVILVLRVSHSVMVSFRLHYIACMSEIPNSIHLVWRSSMVKHFKSPEGLTWSATA